MNDLTVRQATPADVDEMLDVLEAVAAERRFIATEPPVDREVRRAAFLRTLEGGGCFIVAEANGEVVGSLGVEARRGRGDLGMGVAAEWRGRGVGTALLSAAIDWGRESGLHKLVLEVFPHNEAALALYAKFGFEQEGYCADTSCAGAASCGTRSRWACCCVPTETVELELAAALSAGSRW